MRIYKSPSILRKCYPEALWKVNTREKEVFITFDDGPHEEITSWVLELLQDYDARATFFCIGNHVVNNEHTFNKIKLFGHSTGNHSHNHLNGWKYNKEEYLEDVAKSGRVISSPLFRPPYGKLKFSQYESLKEDYKIVMWDIVSYDWDKSLNAEKCLKNIVKNTEEGSIIVFHDSVKAFKNLRFVLPRYLQEISEKGFKFSSLEPAEILVTAGSY